MEAKSNNTLAASQDPSTFGELAKAINAMSRDKPDGNMVASSIPSSFEKRLMAVEFDIKRKNENNSSKALSDEIERLELEQLKQKKVLKTVESSLKKFEKKFDSGSQDLHDNKSVASSKRSGKSKAGIHAPLGAGLWRANAHRHGRTNAYRAVRGSLIKGRSKD